MARVCPYCDGRKTHRYDGGAVKCVCSIGHGPVRGSSTVHLPPRWIETHTLPDAPRTRGECEGVARPCPHTFCRFHLYVSIIDRKAGIVKYTFPHLRLRDMKETCALDVAERDPNGQTLDEVGRLFGLTRERVRQMEATALEKLKAKLPEDVEDD
jgi:hypothetical protein